MPTHTTAMYKQIQAVQFILHEGVKLFTSPKDIRHTLQPFKIKNLTPTILYNWSKYTTACTCELRYSQTHQCLYNPMEQMPNRVDITYTL